MSDVLIWLMMVELIGLAAFPLAYLLLPKLTDRGYGVSKALGILLIGYSAWILSALRLVPSARLTLFALLALLALASAWLAYRRRAEMREFLARKWRLIAAVEIVFLVFLLGWTLFRAFDPAIDHTEQPMDFMLLNSSIRSTLGQPQDAWMAGETVSYYYFGYWMMGALSELSGVASNFSYNLSVALVPALAASAIMSIVLTMTRSDGASARLGVISALAAAVALGVVSNLEGVLEFMSANAIGSQGLYDWVSIDGLDGPAETPTQGWTPEGYWWWFRATRVINTFEDGGGIDYTIQEFPFFSFMLGDLHPHMMAIPFSLLFSGFVLNFFRSETLSLRDPMRNRWGFASAAAMGLTLGGVGFTNMWDMPTCAALLLGVAALKAYPKPRSEDQSPARGVLWRTGLEVLRVPLPVIALAFLLFLPYYLGFASSVEGIGAVAVPTRYLHLFIVWGVPLALVAPFVVASFWQTVVGPDWRGMTAITMLAALLPFAAWMVMRLQSPQAMDAPALRLIHVLPLATLVGMGAWSALYEVSRRGATGRAFALALATLGMLLIMGPELLYVDDFFGQPSERMNTVFKLYYQAWVLLAAASGYCLHYWLTSRPKLYGWRKTLSTAWAVAAAALVIASLYYPMAAAASKAVESPSSANLDGLEFVRRRSPAEYEAILYVRDSLGSEDVILESVGEWFDSGLISRSSGVPTVFNWPGHELQWRGSSEHFAARQGDVAAIYTTTDVDEARSLLAKYGVSHVYVGPRELSAYSGAGMEKFAEFMDIAFQQDEVTIYRKRE